MAKEKEKDKDKGGRPKALKTQIQEAVDRLNALVDAPEKDTTGARVKAATAALDALMQIQQREDTINPPKPKAPDVPDVDVRDMVSSHMKKQWETTRDATIAEAVETAVAPYREKTDRLQEQLDQVTEAKKTAEELAGRVNQEMVEYKLFATRVELLVATVRHQSAFKDVSMKDLEDLIAKMKKTLSISF